MLYTVITAKVMNAGWFINISDTFKRTAGKYLFLDVFFGARIQHLKKEGLVSTFYCDDPFQIMEAQNRGYSIMPFASFTKDVIRDQWQNQKHHWEIEFYVFAKESNCLHSTLAFYSYGPAAEIRTDSRLEHIVLCFPFYIRRGIHASTGHSAATSLRKVMDKARFLSLSDHCFDTLRA